MTNVKFCYFSFNFIKRSSKAKVIQKFMYISDGHATSSTQVRYKVIRFSSSKVMTNVKVRKYYLIIFKSSSGVNSMYVNFVPKSRRRPSVTFIVIVSSPKPLNVATLNFAGAYATLCICPNNVFCFKCISS